MLEQLAPDVYLQPHPLNLLGCKLGRSVTVIRLGSGELLVHSTAKFNPADVAEICELGEPTWLVDATNFHDTCARAGRAAFPDLRYLVPPGFKNADRLGASEIGAKADQFAEELQIIEVGGIPKIREHLFYHRPSGTLVVADLLFNLPAEAGRWTLGFMRAVASIRDYPDMSRFFRFCIKDREAFAESMRKVAALDLKRIVVGHGVPITDDPQARFLEILQRRGFDIGVD